MMDTSATSLEARTQEADPAGMELCRFAILICTSLGKGSVNYKGRTSTEPSEVKRFSCRTCLARLRIVAGETYGETPVRCILPLEIAAWRVYSLPGIN